MMGALEGHMLSKPGMAMTLRGEGPFTQYVVAPAAFNPTLSSSYGCTIGKVGKKDTTLCPLSSLLFPLHLSAPCLLPSRPKVI